MPVLRRRHCGLRMLMRIVLLALIAYPLMADIEAELKKRGFSLLDQICVQVENESPILKSEIERRSKQKGLGFFEAQDELIKERLLWVMAKKQLKYSASEIESSARSHAEKVVKDNKLNKAQFVEILMGPPYEMSYEQYVRETAYAILENHVKSSLYSQVSISDTKLKDQLKKLEDEQKQSFDIVFISALPAKQPGDQSLNRQIKMLKEISAQINFSTSLEQLKRKFKDKKVIFIGPIAYQEGTLKKEYDKVLAKAQSSLVTEPFQDDSAATVIWKIKKPKEKLDENALEKVRKELYEREVIKNLSAAIEAVKNISTVTAKGCGK